MGGTCSMHGADGNYAFFVKFERETQHVELRSRHEVDLNINIERVVASVKQCDFYPE